ncbi:MAG: low affinity iron permease family protein [Ferruginibacter sp.]|nr:low affinity iron permease family protein [Ferruginibacter sp.]
MSNGAIPKKQKGSKGKFDSFSSWVTKATGSPYAFLTALIIVILWAVTGPIFNFSEKWQLIINTGTTIVTFLMIFVIQQSQNKDTLALHLKLNELIAANRYTSNRLIDSEDLTEEELQVIKKYYKKLSSSVEQEESIFKSHSLDEAGEDAKRKK